MAFLQVVDAQCSPEAVDRAGSILISFKTKNSAGTLTTPATHTKIRVVHAGTGTQLVAWTAVTTSPAGTHTYLIKSDVILASTEPGKYIVYIEARDAVTPENYKGKTSFFINR